MASYIQGVTDYIPQLQPFQPDYNFLGNVLQTKQSRYDTSHKQLNKLYGTLLYSPMLRDDNTQQRDQFFQTIDQDIKKMAGLDLSLQENVDSANEVFKSMYDNKGIIKDMTYTKKFQSELERGENYKTCLNQEECGGGYWDVGINAMKYKADEFKNASAEDAMQMAAPTFTPFINVTEKAVKYTKDLMAKGFNVSTTSWSPDGKYIVTSKNGQNLTIPLYQLLQNQYGADPKIQEMYETSAYVQRKNYAQNNAEKFGGDRNAAEDDYVRIIQEEVNTLKIKAIEAQENALNAGAKKTAVAEKIKKEGTTGDDDLSAAFELADIDYTQQNQTSEYTNQTAKIASAITTFGENRKLKLAGVDALVARSLMDGDFKETAINISNLTGDTSVKEDPYAKSYYDHSLAMAKQQQGHKNAMELEVFKTQLEIKKKEATGEITNRGAANSALNSGTYVDALPGTTTSAESTDEQLEMSNYSSDKATIIDDQAKSYVKNYTQYLLNIASDENYTPAEKTSAKRELKNIWKDVYDVNTNNFYKNGKVTDYNSVLVQTPIIHYNAAYASRKNAINNGLYGKFFEETLDPIAKTYTEARQLSDASTKVYNENNIKVKDFALSSDRYLDDDEKDLFGLLFDSNGRLRNSNEYTKMGLSSDDYDDMLEIYKEVYNSGSSAGKTSDGQPAPIVKAFADANATFGLYAEGKTSGGGVKYGFDSGAPAAFGTRGLVTFGTNAKSSNETLYSAGIVGEVDDVIDDDDADQYKDALNSIISDIETGGSKSTDKDRPFGAVTYMDTALSDPNFTAMHIDFSAAYINKNVGTKDNEGWGRNKDIMKNGITVYIPKSNSNNDFTEAFKAKKYDILLNHQPVNIDKKNGGKITVTKNMTTGEYNVTGNLIAYDGNNVRHNVNPSRIYSSNVGGDNVITGLTTYLEQIDAANTLFNQQYLAGVKNPKIYDASKLLPAINRSILQQTGQESDMSPLDKFNQSLQ